MAVTDKQEAAGIDLNIEKASATIGHSQVEIRAADKRVIVYTHADIETKFLSSPQREIQISLGKESNAIVMNGVIIEQAVDGHLVITAPAGTVINKRDPAKAIMIEPGTKMADDTYYLGRFKGRDGLERDWFAAAEDAKDKEGKRLALNFNEAAEYAKNSRAHGYHDWMLPPGCIDCVDPDYNWGGNNDPDILNVIFNNIAKIPGIVKFEDWGGFCQSTGHDLRSEGYWSSTAIDTGKTVLHCQDWRDTFYENAKERLSVRLVRSVAL